MRSIHTFLSALSSTRSRKKKSTIIKTLPRYNEITTKVVQWTLNPFKNFGIQIKKFPDTDPSLDEDFMHRWKDLEDVLQKLSSRRLTGNDAKNVVNRWMGIPSVSPILSRILAKDLRAGAGAKSFNSEYPDLIPSFDVALAKPNLSKIQYPAWVEPKYDGVRLLSIIDNRGNVELCSRNGKPYTNFPNIKKEIASLGLRNKVIDGETKGYSFDQVMTIAHRKKGLDDRNLKFIAFDFLDLDIFQSRAESEPFHIRRANMLEAILGHYSSKSPYLDCIHGGMVHDEGERWDYYEECIDNGDEGIIVKDPDAPYAYKRTNAWIKVKPDFDVDAPIVGFYEGTRKYEGTLGGIVIEHNGVRTEVGSGFSDALRHKIWRNQDKYIGKMVEVRGHELTKDGKIRHPRLHRWREDRDE